VKWDRGREETEAPAEPAGRRDQWRAAKAASAHAQINKTVVRATATPGGGPVPTSQSARGATGKTRLDHSESSWKTVNSTGTAHGTAIAGRQRP